jgi:hypothetical protein
MILLSGAPDIGVLHYLGLPISCGLWSKLHNWDVFPNDLPVGTAANSRSPDGAKRYPGSLSPAVRPAPDYASLHPGYASPFSRRSMKVLLSTE